MRTARKIKSRLLPLKNAQGGVFSFSAIEELDKFQHWIDKNAAGSIGASYADIFSGGESYLFNSLIEEAIHSSNWKARRQLCCKQKKCCVKNGVPTVMMSG